MHARNDFPMYEWAIGRNNSPDITPQISDTIALGVRTCDSLFPLPTFTFLISKPKLLSPEEIQIELRETESWGRAVGVESSNPIVRAQLLGNLDHNVANRSEADWSKFQEWLEKQYSHSHARAIFSFAIKYHEAAFDTAKAAELRTMSQNKAHYVMEALAAYAKYVGRYDRWIEVKKAAGLKWSTKNAVQIVQGILSQESNNAIDWLKSVLAEIPIEYRIPLIFAALTGLRIGEAIKSCRLIYDLNKENKLSDYYDKEMNMLQHFKYPKLFLRRTKNCYISFSSPRLVEIAARI